MSTKNIKNSRTMILRRATTMESPLSTQIIQGAEEIIHFSHPQHPLVQLNYPYIYTCMGCKEYGAGKRFKCKSCDFDLHDFCALAPPALHKHPLHCQHQLIFHSKPGGFMRSRCDACGKAARGYTYRCGACDFEMHPACTKLAKEMEFPVHPHKMNLMPAITSNSGDLGYVCGECNKKRLGRMYGCKVCDYHIHAACAKGMVNGLYANGITAPEKSSMLGAAARIASHMFLGFIGGLVEGIGEGVGEVLMENVAKGRGDNRRRTI